MEYTGASPKVLPSVEHERLIKNTLIIDLRGLALFHIPFVFLYFHVTLVLHTDIYIFLCVECVCLHRGNSQPRCLQHKDEGDCSTCPVYLQFQVLCMKLLVDL